MRIARGMLCILLALLLAMPLWAGGDIIGGQSMLPETEEGLPAAALVNTKIPCRSAILVEPTTGRVLFEKDADTPLPPASITKIMTLLLVMEAIDAGKLTVEDIVTCSPHAASMGGTQIWFEPGEQMTVHELLKAVAIASANDASVALGEHLAGSHEGFVELMNRRASELGMQNTTFKNATGLDADGHLTSARDIATMSAELLRHPLITAYTTVWMDSLRGGKTELVNTNKLVRFYDGATGLKTGTTSGADYCLAASATRGGLSLIAVVLGADTSDNRFGSARGLLDYGFANYEARPVPEPDPPLTPMKVKGGVQREVALTLVAPEAMIIEKGTGSELLQRQELTESLTAPVEEGIRVGTLRILLDGVVTGEYDIVTAESVEVMTLSAAWQLLWNELVCMA